VALSSERAKGVQDHGDVDAFWKIAPATGVR
jgi:hypothetical protein